MFPDNWGHLDFWKTGEWQVIEERLDDLDKNKKLYNPTRKNVFKALEAVDPDNVRVAIVGQDPYPDPIHATGLAFSIPAHIKGLPLTLQNIFREYSEDLHYPVPTSGSLDRWAEQGVLLWNAIPTVAQHQPLSHNWVEWQLLTEELITKLSKQKVVMAFLGGVARDFVKFTDHDAKKVIETSHPSPRGNLNSRVPFLGSRLFSTINTKLASQGVPSIDWRLP